MKNKNQVPATILLVIGAILTAGGIFLFINRFGPMWSFSHKYMTDNAIFVMLGILGVFLGVVGLLLARSLLKEGREIQEGEGMQKHMGIVRNEASLDEGIRDVEYYLSVAEILRNLPYTAGDYLAAPAFGSAAGYLCTMLYNRVFEDLESEE